MFYVKTQGLLISGLLSIALLSSCATPQQTPKRFQKRAAPKAQIIKKQGEQLSTVSKRLDVVDSMPDKLPLELYMSRFLSLNYEFSENDLSFLSNLESVPKAGSLKEAVVSLANLQLVTQNILQGAQPSDFPEGNQDADTSKAENSDTDEAATVNGSNRVLTVAEQFSITGINPVDAFNRNPYLQSIEAYVLLGKTLEISSDGVQIREALTDIIDAKSQTWTGLVESFKNNSAPIEAGEDSDGIARAIDPSQYRAADLLLGDNILLQAQKLAEKGRFKSAITRASKVPNQDPYYPTAKEKIKHFSNLAVQSLRQRAAQAFQSSLPVVDVKTKAAYLEEAKKYLEEALTEFPAADHLTTVRENLAVIAKDLESINQETSTQ